MELQLGPCYLGKLVPLHKQWLLPRLWLELEPVMLAKNPASDWFFSLQWCPFHMRWQ